ncbi:hypothetical protein RFI_25135 [Reticulomyxa filosa]|uniref:Uncharacterized protein n=1 Tax=Reticulomyxa filosa TaxID=46433 RepID=X6MEZ9_RETFI|nr:hypothetical protein RFI_25135 [Reticulomyxa filosa]|eukprot:ETO12241.1 hypothetical protein RFI_25135 [Reticulomyxa filosa]
MQQQFQLPPMLQAVLQVRLPSRENVRGNKKIYLKKGRLFCGSGEQPQYEELPYNRNEYKHAEEPKENEEKSKLKDIMDEIPNGYEVIDACGSQFKKIAPYVNKALTWGWIPLCVYFGLKQGTHKYYPSEDLRLPEELAGTQFERKPSWTDTVPFIGSAGSGQSGLFSSV